MQSPSNKPPLRVLSFLSSDVTQILMCYQHSLQSIHSFLHKIFRFKFRFISLHISFRVTFVLQTLYSLLFWLYWKLPMNPEYSRDSPISFHLSQSLIILISRYFFRMGSIIFHCQEAIALPGSCITRSRIHLCMLSQSHTTLSGPLNFQVHDIRIPCSPRLVYSLLLYLDSQTKQLPHISYFGFVLSNLSSYGALSTIFDFRKPSIFLLQGYRHCDCRTPPTIIFIIDHFRRIMCITSYRGVPSFTFLSPPRNVARNFLPQFQKPFRTLVN